MPFDNSHSEIRALSVEEVNEVSGGLIDITIGGVNICVGPNGFYVVGYGHGIIVSNAGSMAW
jgi:hypothetical protein